MNRFRVSSPLKSFARRVSTARRGTSLIVAFGVAQVSLHGALKAQSGSLGSLLTRAERTNYIETSRYDDVVAFVDAVAAASPLIHRTSFGYTFEGRALPLLVVGNVRDSSPESIRNSGKTRVFIQANIHAGEVCGKEAMQMLLRDLAQGAHPQWADSLILLIAPIYNADGNERFRLTNRGRQHGPLGGMGQRPNAQGFDLNRDHIKIDSPEARALVRVFRDYDPHVGIDLHTTNGTRHGYHLTYSPPLHPNTDGSIDDLLREEWLPATQAHLKAARGWDSYYYGNDGNGGGLGRGWYTFDHRPRFNNNYLGLRNRFAILSEAYSYATFEERVLATLSFVEGAVDFAHANASRIRGVVEQLDAASLVGEALALRAGFARTGPVDILLGEVDEEQNPYSGAMILRRRDVATPVRMAEYGTFEATESERVPESYLVPVDLREVVNKLRDHGVSMTVMDGDRNMRVEAFSIDSTVQSNREFEQHRERTMFGSYTQSTRTVAAGTYVVSTRQPLGRLIFTLLEPRSDDGLVNWNVFDRVIEGLQEYPVLRTFER